MSEKKERILSYKKAHFISKEDLIVSERQNTIQLPTNMAHKVV